jgi:anti-sigma regulatory factor (Ser/Thr protein kinase)
MLRAVANQPHVTPGQALAQVNELLCPDLPASMFVTCFYAILDPTAGTLQFANAGQDLPYLRHSDGSVSELWAAGMPLGLMPGMQYDEHDATLQPGEYLLLYSDGLVEAHNPDREMFGFSRLMTLLSGEDQSSPLIVFLLHELANFTGAGWEQEDDITLVALFRAESDEPGMSSDALDAADSDGSESSDTFDGAGNGAWRVLGAWALASQPSNERAAIQHAQDALQGFVLAPERLERLKTAIGEATMNAMEHGNGYQADLPVQVEALASRDAIMVRITDQGGPFALADTPAPDLDAKLAGLQSPRGWGLFLIEHLVDEARVTGEGSQHTIELIMRLDTPSS